MKVSRIIVFCFTVVFTLGIMPGMLTAEESKLSATSYGDSSILTGNALTGGFRIAVVQDDNVHVHAYAPLVAHLVKMGVAVTLVKVPTYKEVAALFSSGEVDAMFNGPGIPGSMIVIDRLKEKWFSADFKTRDSRMQQAMTGSATRKPRRG